MNYLYVRTLKVVINGTLVLFIIMRNLNLVVYGNSKYRLKINKLPTSKASGARFTAKIETSTTNNTNHTILIY